MTYQEFPPAPALAGLVASYWRFSLPASAESAPLLHTVPPDGAVSLCWLPHGRASLVGPRLTALRVPVVPGSAYLGVRFVPGAAGPLLGVDVPSLRDAVLPIDRSDFAEVMQSSGLAGLDALVLQWSANFPGPCPNPAVAKLTRRILQSDGAVPVTKLLEGLNLSYRQILRLFHNAIGLTPKEFARLRRLRSACLEAIRTAEPRWADVSADAGFSDQSHLAREFQDVCGWPPRLVHEYLRRIAHQGVSA